MRFRCCSLLCLGAETHVWRFVIVCLFYLFSRSIGKTVFNDYGIPGYLHLYILNLFNIHRKLNNVSSRKHTYIILTPLNPTFI